MAELNTDAPATPSAEAPATLAPAAAPRGDAASRRAAALDVAITADDAGEDVAEGDEPTATAAEPVAAEPPKAEDPPKPPEVDPLAARAAADRFLMREREALKAEREAIAKERADWEASRKEAPDTTAELQRFHQTLAADPVAYADAQGWTVQQRYEAAKALSWSAHPEDKRPPGWRGNGQGVVLSEVERLKQENAKLAEKMTTWEKTQAEAREKAERAAQDASLGESILKVLPADLAYAAAFAKARPEQARAQLAALARQMVDAERAAAEREYRDPRQLTEADVAKEYDKRWKAHLDAEYGWAAEVRSASAAPAKPTTQGPRVPPATGTASPTQAKPSTSKLSPEARRAAREAALATLPDKLD